MTTISTFFSKNLSIKAEPVGNGIMLMHFPEDDTAMPAIFLQRKDNKVLLSVDKGEEDPLFLNASIGSVQVDRVFEVKILENLLESKDPEEVYKILVEGLPESNERGDD